MESRMTIGENGAQKWYNKNGKLHRTDGPAVIWADGTQLWYQNGQRHRTDGPAMVGFNRKEWYQNGKRHRIDGPAIVAFNKKLWYQNGQIHRENGPAVIWADGTQLWYQNGISLSFTEWADALNLDQKTRLGMVLKWNPE